MKKLIVLIFISLLASAGYAASNGNIVGTSKGPDGAPFKAAFVLAQNVQTRMVTIVLSDAKGRYLVNNLAPGTYEVWANYPEFKSDPAKRTDIKVQDGQRVSLNFTLQKGSLQWSQLTRYQAGMLLPIPASEPEAKDKDVLLQNCFGCHGMSKWGIWFGAESLFRVGYFRRRTASEMAAVQDIN